MTRTRFATGLYGVTPDWDDPVQLEQAVRQAARGGMTAVQLRLKTVASGQKLKIAKRLQSVCEELGVIHIINDDWQLAAEIGAHGVHLGRDDADPHLVRAELGPDRLIGVSCYDEPERAARLLTVPVDYIAFGAMFKSATKPQARSASPLLLTDGRRLAERFVRDDGSRPSVVAIGGITPDNAAQLIEAGADSIAVVGALFMAPDIEASARKFSQLFSNGQAACVTPSKHSGDPSHDPQR